MTDERIVAGTYVNSNRGLHKNEEAEHYGKYL